MMANAIIKLTDGASDWYLEWSNVVDAPLTVGMSKDDITQYLIGKYGTNNHTEAFLAERFSRVEENGTSYYGTTLEELIAGNRAGENEKELTYKELVEEYCKAGMDC